MSKLYFYHGAMNSGKSAHILMQVYNLRGKGKKVLVLKPRFDSRAVGVIKSRALDTEIEAVLIDESVNVLNLVLEEKPDFVFVDEVNFLSLRTVEQLAQVVDDLDIPVFGYGLLVDFKSFQFEGSKRMVELADSVRELKSPCAKCHRKATMHLRVVNGEYEFEGDSCQVGDLEDYESVCRTCYREAVLRQGNQ